jgi:hypothetical protein
MNPSKPCAWRSACTLLALTVVFVTPALGAPVVFHVNLGQASATPVSGRLLVFAKVLGPDDKRPVARVDMDQIDTHATAIAAQEVAHLEPGATVELDADVVAFPTPFSQLKPGHYAVQAVLDRDQSYNYTGLWRSNGLVRVGLLSTRGRRPSAVRSRCSTAPQA